MLLIMVSHLALCNYPQRKGLAHPSGPRGLEFLNHLTRTWPSSTIGSKAQDKRWEERVPGNFSLFSLWGQCLYLAEWLSCKQGTLLIKSQTKDLKSHLEVQVKQVGNILVIAEAALGNEDSLYNSFYLCVCLRFFFVIKKFKIPFGKRDQLDSKRLLRGWRCLGPPSKLLIFPSQVGM